MIRGASVLFGSVLFCLAFCASPGSAALADQRTDDLLNDIDRVQPPVPSRGSDASANRGDEAGAHIDWPRLLRLFGPSIWTAIAIGIACSVTGPFILLRREGLIGLALPQIVALGAAVGMRMGWPTLPPAMVAVAAAVAIMIGSRRHAGIQIVLPALYVAGLSVSFLVIANHGRDVEDLTHLITGGIDVAVSPQTACITIPLLGVIALVTAVLWRRWLLLAQAPAAAELAGLRTARWDGLFLALLALTLLLGASAQGIILVLVMLFLPAAAVLPWARSIPAALWAAACLSVVLVGVGFYLSNTLQWPMSQSIGGVGCAVVAASHLLRLALPPRH